MSSRIQDNLNIYPKWDNFKLYPQRDKNKFIPCRVQNKKISYIRTDVTLDTKNYNKSGANGTSGTHVDGYLNPL